MAYYQVIVIVKLIRVNNLNLEQNLNGEQIKNWNFVRSLLRFCSKFKFFTHKELKFGTESKNVRSKFRFRSKFKSFTHKELKFGTESKNVRSKF
jgi:hypothetical protein